MKAIRFAGESEERYGVIENGSINETKSFPWNAVEYTGRTFELSEIQYLSPVIPGKIVGFGLNYRDHAAELGMEIPKEPVLFMKPSSAVIGNRDFIMLPAASDEVQYEAELCVLMGKRAKNIEPEDAFDFIWGYMCANDVTARDLQRRDGQWTRSKAFDTFSPIGPFAVSDLDPSDLRITAVLNGELRQDSSTSMMVFEVPQLVSFVSKIMTLDVGDVILTGTPPGVGTLKKGDIIEIEIENIGRLTNSVKG